jgi:hypothetical protein
MKGKGGKIATEKITPFGLRRVVVKTFLHEGASLPARLEGLALHILTAVHAK